MVSVNRYCIIFFISVANTSVIILYVRNFLISEKFSFCVFGRDIDRQKFCKYGWNNLFRKSSVIKEYKDENLVVSDRNKLAIDIFRKREKEKK